MLTVQALTDYINTLAPFETQLDFDNCGLLIGDPASEVRGIHVALDCTEAVIDEAVKRGANVIVTHHPVIFGGYKNLREDHADTRMLCRLVRLNMAVISAHTCLDRAPGGINDVLAHTIGLTDVRGEDFLRVGTLPTPMTADAFCKQLQDSLGTAVRVMGCGSRMIHSVGLCSGSGSEYWHDALLLGADAFVSGEIKHHHALSAAASGMICFECGHHATEEPGIFALADTLQTWDDVVKYNVYVTKSQLDAYAARL